MCGLATTRLDGMKLLQGRPEGTFLLRLSSQPGALAVMYVKPMQEASQCTGPGNGVGLECGVEKFILGVILLSCRPEPRKFFYRRRHSVGSAGMSILLRKTGRTKVLVS